VTDDSAFKKQVRTRMAETGENYTTARRMVIAGRDPGPEPVALRVFLNPHVDLELTYEMARAYAATDEQGQRNMATRLLAEHIEMAGVDGAGVAAGSEIVAVQDLRIDQIADAVNRRIPRAAGITTIASGPTWITSGLRSRLTGQAWRSAIAVRSTTGSAPNWRS